MIPRAVLLSIGGSDLFGGTNVTFYGSKNWAYCGIGDGGVMGGFSQFYSSFIGLILIGSVARPARRNRGVPDSSGTASNLSPRLCDVFSACGRELQFALLLEHILSQLV